MRPVRVVIADDSEIAVQCIEGILSAQEGVRVVRTVGTSRDLLQAIEATDPDVITLDLLMPDRTGLALIRGLSAKATVVVVSDHSADSMLASESLAQGAWAFVEKRSLSRPDGRARLLDAVVRGHGAASSQGSIGRRIVAIAGSTGAIPCIEAFAVDLGSLNAAVAIVQHLPHERVAGFASWLNTLGVRAQVVRGGEALVGGRAFVAPGDKHLRVARGVRCELWNGPPIKGHKPAATALFESLIDRASEVVAVVLSGMGDDGAAALSRLVAGGARCVVQKRSTCAVSGMPDAALVAAGSRTLVLEPREIGLGIAGLLGRSHA